MIKANIPIIQYWDAEPLPHDVKRAIQSFRDHNPKLEHRLFNGLTARSFIEEHFTSREVAAFAACAVPSMQSDYVRYCGVLALGGLYADVDMLCVANLAPLVSSVEEAQFFYRPRSNFVLTTNLFIVRSSGHPLLRFLLEVATFNIEQRSFDNAWLATGPALPSTLYGIHACGSADAYRQSLVEQDPKPQNRLKLLDIVLAAGGTSDLLAGVQFAPVESRQSFVVGKSMSYQQHDRHWKNWKAAVSGNCPSRVRVM